MWIHQTGRGPAAGQGRGSGCSAGWNTSTAGPQTQVAGLPWLGFRALKLRSDPPPPPPLPEAGGRGGPDSKSGTNVFHMHFQFHWAAGLSAQSPDERSVHGAGLEGGKGWPRHRLPLTPARTLPRTAHDRNPLACPTDTYLPGYPTPWGGHLGRYEPSVQGT